MEFLGYTKVKPFRRQFEQVSAPGPEQVRYLNPGRTSSNLEPPGWFFQYLRPLPVQQLHAEPLCAAGGA